MCSLRSRMKRSPQCGNFSSLMTDGSKGGGVSMNYEDVLRAQAVDGDSATKKIRKEDVVGAGGLTGTKSSPRCPADFVSAVEMQYYTASTSASSSSNDSHSSFSAAASEALAMQRMAAEVLAREVQNQMRRKEKRRRESAQHLDHLQGPLHNNVEMLHAPNGSHQGEFVHMPATAALERFLQEEAGSYPPASLHDARNTLEASDGLLGGFDGNMPAHAAASQAPLQGPFEQVQPQYHHQKKSSQPQSLRKSKRSTRLAQHQHLQQQPQFYPASWALGANPAPSPRIKQAPSRPFIGQSSSSAFSSTPSSAFSATASSATLYDSMHQITQDLARI